MKGGALLAAFPARLEHGVTGCFVAPCPLCSAGLWISAPPLFRVHCRGRCSPLAVLRQVFAGRKLGADDLAAVVKAARAAGPGQGLTVARVAQIFRSKGGGK